MWSTHSYEETSSVGMLFLLKVVFTFVWESLHPFIFSSLIYNACWMKHNLSSHLTFWESFVMKQRMYLENNFIKRKNFTELPQISLHAYIKFDTIENVQIFPNLWTFYTKDDTVFNVLQHNPSKSLLSQTNDGCR